MRLKHEEYVDHVRADAERMAAVAERGLDPPVPSRPGWTVRDAVEHTAVVFLHDPLALDGADEVLRRFLAGDWSDEPVPDRPPTAVDCLDAAPRTATQ